MCGGARICGFVAHDACLRRPCFMWRLRAYAPGHSCQVIRARSLVPGHSCQVTDGDRYKKTQLLIHYGTVWYNMVLYGTLQYSTVHYGTLRRVEVWYIKHSPPLCILITGSCVSNCMGPPAWWLQPHAPVLTLDTPGGCSRVHLYSRWTHLVAVAACTCTHVGRSR